MEQMEDKMIRAKIDALHTLPEGYAPSLDSKWELLQAGLEGKKEKFPIYWISIAAGFLLLIGFGWVMMKNDVKNEALPVAKTERKMIDPSIEDPAKQTIPAEEATASNDTRKPLDKRSFAVVPQKKEQENIKIDIEHTITSQETLFVDTAPAIAKSTAKPKKKKFVEMEFSDSPQANPSMEAQADGRIRIRFMPQQEHSAAGNNESASIKLKKSF